MLREDKKIFMLYENPYIYDGWSVVEYEDGTLENRWPVGDYRHAKAEEFLAEIKEGIANE